MKLKHIEFTFENCDMIRIDGEHIGVFLVDDISTSIRRLGCNSIDKMDVAKTIAIEIFKDANKERDQFGQTQNEDFKQMTFDRFMEYNDITNIQFELIEDNGNDTKTSHAEYYDYYVDWTGDSEYTNGAQKTCIGDDGSLCILIADGKKIKEIFQ